MRRVIEYCVYNKNPPKHACKISDCNIVKCRFLNRERIEFCDG